MKISSSGSLFTDLPGAIKATDKSPPLDKYPRDRFKQASDSTGTFDVGQPKTMIANTDCTELLDLLDGRPLVLVGMMGAGKTTVGRRLATRLGRKFIDSDAEIEKAAGMEINDFFALHGEPEFRAGESRVISRIMKDKNIVLGTGGGAFINPETRALIGAEGVSVWLKADFDTLFARVSRRANRPLLKTANPRATLKRLMQERDPVYAEADITVISRDVPHDVIIDTVITQVRDHLRDQNRT